MTSRLPRWVSTLFLDFDPDAEEEAGAAVVFDYAQRSAVLQINPRFAHEPVARRRSILIHETAHLLNAPVAEFMKTVVKLAFLDSDAARILEALFTNALEAATQDTALAIMHAMGDLEAAHAC